MRLRFEDYVLDLERRQLLHDGAEVPISPKAFQLLRTLVENEPRAMSKKELYDALWPDTFVTDSNLAGLVRELRAALNDRKRSTGLIRTVHRFGYAFSEHASQDQVNSEPSAMSRYRLLWGRRELVLREGETLLGRDPDATLYIDDSTVSRHHARICVDGEVATIEDLDSKNGTQVSGQRVARLLTLSDGDRLVLGSVEMTFRIAARRDSTLTIAGRAEE